MKRLLIMSVVAVAAACNVEASDPGKEAFCHGIEELGADVRAGKVSRFEALERVTELIAEGQASPDDEFVDNINNYLDPGASTESFNEIAEACSDYADLDAVL